MCFRFRFLTSNVLGKVPHMAFRIRRPITPMAVLRVGWLLEDDGTSFARASKMFVDALYINVQALRGLAKALRIAITGPGTPHHNQGVAKLHRNVIDLAVRAPHLDAVLAESE